MLIAEERAEHVKIFARAKEGCKEAQRILKEKFNLKVYTNLEVKAVNYFQGLKKDRVMGEKVFPEDRYVKLKVGHNKEQERNHKINWIEDIEEGFYLFGVKVIPAYSGDPYDEACAVWMFYFDGERFIPLFNTSEWTIEDFNYKARRLINE